MASAAADVHGLKEFKADLKAIAPEWSKELRKVHKAVANEGAAGAVGIALGMGGQQGKEADAIKPRATDTTAAIGISVTKGRPFANAAFWGAKRRTGWYAAPQYAASAGKQFKPWVGNTWDAATFDGGPYVINRALALDLPHLIHLFEVLVDDLTRRAFPDGAPAEHLPE